jgi:hypothetical protein
MPDRRFSATSAYRRKNRGSTCLVRDRHADAKPLSARAENIFKQIGKELKEEDQRHFLNENCDDSEFGNGVLSRDCL